MIFRPRMNTGLMARAVGAIAVLAASGCVASSSNEISSAAGTSCPFAIVDAEAWVNRMPGPAARPRLNVLAALDKAAPAPRLVLREGGGAGEPVFDLVLGLSTAPKAKRAQYRGAEIDDLKTITVACNGETVAVISQIQRVY